MVRFYLESLVEGGRQLRRIAVHTLPFRVGRLSGQPLCLASESVSKEHAEVVMRDGNLWVQDLGSKNGTFDNSERVSEARLNEGDIVHFAQVEFRDRAPGARRGPAALPRTLDRLARRDEAAPAVRGGGAGAPGAARRPAGRYGESGQRQGRIWFFSFSWLNY